MAVGLGRGEGVGPSLGDGDATFGPEGDGATEADGDGDSPEEQAARSVSRARTAGNPGARRIGLVRVVAELTGRDRRQGIVVEEADLAAQELELGA